MGNIPKVVLGNDGPIKGLEGNFGWDSRHCWIAEQGKVLVGADASGIQLRALSHYMNDEDYIKEVTTGDVHVANQLAAGISDRPTAKTFIYAWLLGAGDEKIGTIVGVTQEEEQALFNEASKEFRWNRFRHNIDKKPNKYDNLLWFVSDKLRNENRKVDKKTVSTIIKGYFTKKKFLENLPALKRFKEIDIKESANNGFMVGLDGRKIWVPSEHLAMGAFLQGFEAVIMKWAMILYQNRLTTDNVPFKQVGYVHDEFQIETSPEYADQVGKTVVWSIEEAGKLLGSNCPLTGEFHVGASWGETH